jgi:hypothetical protein
MWIDYKLLTVLPSRSIHQISSCCKLENIEDFLKHKKTLVFEIENLKCNNKKVAYIDWKLLDMLRSFNLNPHDFHEESHKAIGQILLDSKKLHVIELT